jgi:hypothetical protein
MKVYVELIVEPLEGGKPLTFSGFVNTKGYDPMLASFDAGKVAETEIREVIKAILGGGSASDR